MAAPEIRVCNFLCLFRYAYKFRLYPLELGKMSGGRAFWFQLVVKMLCLIVECIWAIKTKEGFQIFRKLLFLGNNDTKYP